MITEGEEFAPTPDRATREQQILIANRIATFGYTAHLRSVAPRLSRLGVPPHDRLPLIAHSACARLGAIAPLYLGRNRGSGE